jgi:hypothetical protein
MKKQKKRNTNKFKKNVKKRTTNGINSTIKNSTIKNLTLLINRYNSSRPNINIEKSKKITYTPSYTTLEKEMKEKIEQHLIKYPIRHKGCYLNGILLSLTVLIQVINAR